MAAATINQSPFPSGAAVSVYTRNGGRPLELPSVPGQTLVTTAAAGSGGTVALTGLVEGAKYWAVGQDTTGAWRWVAFRVDKTLERGEAGDHERLRRVEDLLENPESSVTLAGPPFLTGRMRNRDRWTARDFGATGNGNDFTTELTNAVRETRAASRVLHIPEGHYGVSATLTGSEKTPLAVRGEGKGLTVLEHGIPGGPMFSVLGAIGSIKTITAPSVLGASSQVISATSGLAPEDIVVLRDTSQIIYGDATRIAESVWGEFERIKTVDSGTGLTYRGRLANPYTTAGDLRKLTAVDGVLLADLTMHNPTPGTLGVTSRGLVATYARNVRVLNVEFLDFDASMVYLQTVYGWRVEGSTFSGSRDLETANAPYCVIITNGTAHGQMNGCDGDYGRHLFTTGSSATEPAPAWATVSDCIGTHFGHSTFDTHPGSRRIVFFNPRVYSSGSLEAIQIRGPDSGVVNPFIEQAATAVAFFYGADRGRCVGVGRISGADIAVLVNSCQDVVIGDGLQIDSDCLIGVQTDQDSDYPGMTGLSVRGLTNNAVTPFVWNKWDSTFQVEAIRRAGVGGAQTIATDAPFTLTAHLNAQQIFHTGTLTANRVITLATANASNGHWFRVTRTGGGAFNLDLGGLKNLATNTWAVVEFDGTIWKLAAYGAL